MVLLVLYHNHLISLVRGEFTAVGGAQTSQDDLVIECHFPPFRAHSPKHR